MTLVLLTCLLLIQKLRMLARSHSWEGEGARTYDIHKISGPSPSSHSAITPSSLPLDITHGCPFLPSPQMTHDVVVVVFFLRQWLGRYLAENARALTAVGRKREKRKLRTLHFNQLMVL